MISTERLLSMSAIEGMKLVLDYHERHPKLEDRELLSLISRVDANGGKLDLIASIELKSLVGNIDTNDHQIVYQRCIQNVLIAREPNWIKLMTQGRMRFIKGLGLDDHDVFAAAGLLAETPGMEIVTWWDALVAHSRQVTDLQKMDQARQAERLSIEHETERLLASGISKKPGWPGLDNNFAGYDVLSYVRGAFGLENKMIEVKSTIASPLRFIVTKYEWSQAEKFGSSYIFHVWDMSCNPPALHERTVTDVMPHIPTDNQKGIWKSAEIPVGI